MWQQELLRNLESLVAAHPSIDAIRPHGSVATGELDSWSDLDVVLTVPCARLRYVFPDLGWLAPLGSIYAMSSNFGAEASVVRIVFENLERLDIRIIPAEPATTYLPSDRGAPIPLTPIQERTAVFLFEALLATAKIGRNDFLIGGHLVLNLERMVLELAML
ncbi:MAG: nucleotidyltransferase domain-containing protein, partial [Thermomicrobiales bacterium]